MGLLSQVMAYYPYVVHPITVLGVGFLVLIRYEWAHQSVPASVLWRRVGGFLGAGLVGLLPTAGYFLLSGSDVVGATKGNSWEMDALVASGILIAAGITWALWRRYEWGSLVPNGTQVLVAAVVPYALLSPVWNVSGHVLIALVPTLYLTLVDRAYWPSLVFPVVMVPNRIYLDAHTWPQVIGAFLLATVVVVGLYRRQTVGSRERDSGVPVD